MQKSKFKTSIIVLLVLVVIAGAVGVCVKFLPKKNVSTASETFKVVIEDFSFEHNDAGDGYYIFLSSKVLDALEKQGYVDIIFEIKDETLVDGLTWSFYDSNSQPTTLDYASFDVSENTLSATMKITSLSDIEDNMFYFAVLEKNSEEEYPLGAFFVVFISVTAYVV